MWVDVICLTALGLVTSGTVALMLTPITALGGVVTPALQAILSRDTPDNAQGELQGVLASLNAIAMITAPLAMTATFAHFTAPNASIFAPGAPFLLAAILMFAAIALHVKNPLDHPETRP
jgi:DHA1 family tetracycline resistance protein-like MFS transporter